MKLYYAPGACSLASHILLNELGATYELEKVDLRSKQTETGRDFKTINPKGYVPALEIEGGELLTENLAILPYIADQADQGDKLLPRQGVQRWRALETTAFVATEVHKRFHPFFDPAANDDEKARARKLIEQRLSLLEARLVDHDFIAGENFSIADAYLFVVLNWAPRHNVEIPPRLKAYFKRIAARESVANTLSQEELTLSA